MVAIIRPARVAELAGADAQPDAFTLRDYLARPEFRQLVLLNGDAVFADTSYDLDRALVFHSDQIEVISLNRQAKGADLAELE